MKVGETAEAICSALYRTGFEHLGDTDENATTWFRRGDKPRLVRVRVERVDRKQRNTHVRSVFITIEWPNIALGGHVLRGVQQLQVDCTVADRDVALATEAAVLRCLEVARDVAGGVGVAGADYARKALASRN